MTKIVPLREIAAARTGDKGNISCVSVWAYDPKHYDDIKASLTAERIATTWPDLFRGRVERFEIPALHGLNFVIHDALEGGVNASLNLDFHGKSFSFLLLELPVEVHG